MKKIIVNFAKKTFFILRKTFVEIIRKRGLKDPYFLASIAIGVLLALPGFKWGEYDCLNLDRLAFKNIFSGERRPFEPSSYVKPPFYTYMNHFVARVPAMALANACFFKERQERYEIFLRLRTSFARCLNMVFFALCTTVIFILARAFYSLFAARAAALLFASSCGFIPYQVFLTTDLAVVSMMLASFVFAVKILRNPNMANSVAAGLLAGLACATKYNGLAVAAALPLAHIIAGLNGNLILKALRRKSAWVCGFCVPLGFILGNPYALIDWPKFKSDFLYNYTVTPVYAGFSNETGYLKFFHSFNEIFGLPGAWLLLLCFISGFFWLLFNYKKTSAWMLWLLAGSVLFIYTYKIGAFPRMETRFVLPAAPFALILAIAGIEAFRKIKLLFMPVLAAVVAFNLICGFYIGGLFAEDPRNVAIDYYKKYLNNGFIMEYSESLPKPEALKVKGTSLKMRSGLERAKLFEKMFQDDQGMLTMVRNKENQIKPEWFSMEERKKRGTDFVIWSSIDLEGIVRNQYDELFDESNGYKKIYDESSPKVPDWVYPKYTEFLRNRTTIWIQNWKS
jgi:hypothetical protein